MYQKSFLLASACVLLLANSTVVHAQEPVIDNDAEAAACAVLDEITEMMADHVAAEDRWIDANRPGRNASNATYDNFNRRVHERNGIGDMYGRFIEDYNAQCTGSVLRSAYLSLCYTQYDRMNDYLYHGETCTRWRERLAE